MPAAIPDLLPQLIEQRQAQLEAWCVVQVDLAYASLSEFMGKNVLH
jgi:hypothetical protein